jgi:fibronectin type 3 domain-containing protein
MFYIDSLAQNNYEYQYRVKGISPFGEVGPTSDIIKGAGRKALVYNPAITNAELSQDESQVELFWEFPEEGLATISHFEIQRSNTVKGTYVTVMETIDKNKRRQTLTNLEGINYFKIAAVGLRGEQRASFPKMVQLNDSIPPLVPQALSGVVDSTGIVTLKWQTNVEADFLGYRVFRANLKTEEFTQITFEPIPVPVFIDTIAISTLNSKVYYKIKAYDKRYNPSEFSQVLELKKPDVVPPTQPVLQAYNANEKGVLLNWIASSSEDAVQTLIYRKQQGKEEAWQLVSRVDLPQHEFTDTTVIPDHKYLYTLITIDASGLESPPIRPLAIAAAKLKPLAIERFVGLVNAEARFIALKWNSKQVIEEYTLFRAKEDQPLSTYKVLDGGTRQFKDGQLQINTSYRYAIQGLLPNGLKTPLKTIQIEY